MNSCTHYVKPIVWENGIFFYDSEWMREGWMREGWMLEWILRTQFRAYFIGLQGRLQGTPSIFTSPEVLQ